MTADTPGELPGKRLLGSRRTEKQGVREVRAVFEDANLIFQEVDLGNDIGKDAYVDLSEGGRFRGAMVALQIKAGASYRDGANYQIPCNAHDRAVWSGSVVPVYGMVYDPDADTIHWINLTTWSRGLKEGERSSSCPVPRGNLLAPETLEAWVTIVRLEIAKQIRPPLLDLMSTDAQRQVAAVSECFGLGPIRPAPSEAPTSLASLACRRGCIVAGDTDPLVLHPASRSPLECRDLACRRSEA